MNTVTPRKRTRSASTARTGEPSKRSRATKRPRRSSDDVLNRIVQAATEEFKRQGYSGATTASIARKAEVTEAQLFRCFGSKANLFRETVFKPLDQHIMEFSARHIPDLGRAEVSKEMTQAYTSELQRFIAGHSRMLMSLVVAQTYGSEMPHGVGEIDSLGMFFDHGAAMMQKRLKGKAKIDPRLMVRLAFVAVLGSVMFRDWIFPRGLASDSELEAAINTFVMEGIGANDRR